ncbi:MAG: tetratricopeptide repeat protein [Chitinophagaceae bacterium]|nr:tetratricopeptide repeat protein [Chitinophagaceae bacterium]
MWKLTLRFLKLFLLLPLILLVVCLTVFSQQKRDSLLKELTVSKEDTVTHNILFKLSIFYFHANNADSALLYALESKKLANSLNSKKHLANSLSALSLAYQLIGNYPKRLEIDFAFLQMMEESNDSLDIAIALSGISGTYDDLEDFEQAVIYEKRAYYIYRNCGDKFWLLTSANSIGYYYIQLAIPDSALTYFQKGHELSNQSKEAPDAMYAFSLYGLGKVNYQLGHINIAIPYYQKSIEYAKLDDRKWNLFVLLLSYSGIADIFKDRGNTDSAFVYYNKALESNPDLNRVKLTIYRNVASMYEGKDDRLAVKYLKLEARLRDSLLNSKTSKAIQTLTYNEYERQRELNTQREEEKRIRIQNLQYAAIAVGAISFFIIYLLLSQTTIVSLKVIRLLGVVALLVTFEFINLLIHPFLARVTHHSPVLILLAMVCVAAIIVPFHHYLEKWMITLLQEKNKKIRLAAAKKTIAELEEQPSTT